MLRAQEGRLQDTAVKMADFVLALQKVNKSVGDSDLLRYSDWMAEFGST
jgi:hypothetical protein